MSDCACACACMCERERDELTRGLLQSVSSLAV